MAICVASRHEQEVAPWLQAIGEGVDQQNNHGHREHKWQDVAVERIKRRERKRRERKRRKEGEKKEGEKRGGEKKEGEKKGGREKGGREKGEKGERTRDRQALPGNSIQQQSAFQYDLRYL